MAMTHLEFACSCVVLVVLVFQVVKEEESVDTEVSRIVCVCFLCQAKTQKGFCKDVFLELPRRRQ